MESLYALLLWWLGISLPGLIAFVLIRPYAFILPDSGYALAKAVGIVGLSYAAWLLASFHLVPFGTIGLYGILSIAAIAALWTIIRNRKTTTPYISKLIISEEVIFLASLLAWGYVRSFNPRAEGVEKLMDVGILNGLLRTDWLPPLDVWYAGSPINYYYFGHFIVATLTKLTHVPVEYASNLGLIGVFALTVTIAFSIVVAATSSKLAAAIAAFLLALSGNLDPAVNAIKQTKDYIFFSATRLDPYTINEFPLYSFIVADMHAHMLGLPIAVSIIGLLYILFRSDESLPWPLLAVLVILLGATGPTNSFDLIIYGGLTFLALLGRQVRLRGIQARSVIAATAWSAAIGLASLTAYLPFYLHFHPGVGGIGIDLFKTPLLFILNNFGIMLFICVPLLYLGWKWWWRKAEDEPVAPPFVFGILLLLMALIAILIPEFIYLRDIYSFQNPPYARANTIFKIYYQAWVLLAIASGFAMGWMRRHDWPKGLAVGYVVIVGSLIGLSLVGTTSGFNTMKGQQSSTLDGYAWLKSERPDQLALVNWINTHIQGQPRLLEAAGESYTQRSLISSYTGLIVPIGWASHEWGWRYSPTQWNAISARMGDVSIMYKTTDPTQLRQLVDKWNIDYIVASPVEMQEYALTGFDTISRTYGDPVFERGEYRLFKVE